VWVWSETEVQTPLGVKVEAVTVLTGEKKKISISGEEKNAIDFLEEHVMGRTLLFLGAGGHVETSGILNLLPFGVEHISSSFWSSSSPFTSLVPEEKEEEEEVEVVDFFFCILSSTFLRLISVVEEAGAM